MDVRAGFLIARELGFLNRARDGVAVGRLVPRASWGKVVLLRYCARPPFAADRLEELDAQRLLYRLPKPGPDGRAQIILSPLELIGHIATPPVPPGRGDRRSGTRTLRSMPSLPRQVPLAIPTPSPRRSTSTTSGCPGKAAGAELLARLMPALRKHD